MKKFTWLYIIFIHDFTEETPFDKVFSEMVSSLEKQDYSETVQVVFIKSSLIKLRSLTPIEKQVLLPSKEKENLYFCKISIHKSEKGIDEKIKMSSSKNEIFNYWQEAFDFVLSEYSAEHYILHTASHSSGFEINGSPDGFVINAYGNRIQKEKNIPAYHNKYFKKYLKKILKEKSGKYFLKGFIPHVDFKDKGVIKVNPKKMPLTKWATSNGTNGLLLYDFSEYLKTRKVIFKFVLLENCYAMLLENIYYLKDSAENILGATGLIDKRLIDPQIIYTSLVKSNSTEIIRKNIVQELSARINPTEKLLLAATKNIDNLFNCFNKIMLLLNTIYSSEAYYGKVKKNELQTAEGLQISPISDEDTLQFYDIVELLRKFAGNKNQELLKLIDDFEALCNECILPLHSAGSKYPSILYPFKFTYSYLAYLRSLYRKPYSNFSEKNLYSDFIAKVFFQ